jgi:hypothetical protein
MTVAALTSEIARREFAILVGGVPGRKDSRPIQANIMGAGLSVLRPSRKGCREDSANLRFRARHLVGDRVCFA